MKKLFLIPIISFSLISCVDDTPKCESHDVTTTVKEIIQQNIKDEYLLEIPIENIKINMIRASGKNEELKKCECEAEVTTGVPLLPKIDITYEAQLNEKEEIIVTVNQVEN